MSVNRKLQIVSASWDTVSRRRNPLLESSLVLTRTEAHRLYLSLERCRVIAPGGSGKPACKNWDAEQ